MASNESEYYISLEDPKTFRKDLLGSTKVIIKLLQRYEILKSIRTKKTEVMFKYAKNITEINMLVNKLKRVMPKAKLKNIPQINNPSQENKSTTSNNFIQSESTSIKKSQTNINDLHDQLAEIEARLSKLD